MTPWRLVDTGLPPLPGVMLRLGVALTPLGHRTIDAAVTDHVANQHRLVATLDAGDRGALDALLGKWLAGFDREDGSDGPEVEIDAGRQDLVETCEFQRPAAFLMTHYHADHAQGLMRLRWGKGPAIPVHGPRCSKGFDDLFIVIIIQARQIQNRNGATGRIGICHSLVLCSRNHF